VGPICRWPREKERGKGWSGPPGRAGLEEKVGRRKKIGPSGEGKKKEREEGYSAGLRGEGERGFGRFCFFKNSFQTFQIFFKLLKL
jgi:hypothetical protein